MIKVDISKVIPGSAFNYLVAFIPGLFFELSLLLGNPQLVHDLIERSQAGITLGPYVSTSLALISAFIIGFGFMLFVRLIQRFFAYVQFISSTIWRQLNKSMLLPLANFLFRFFQARPTWNRPWVSRRVAVFHRLAHMQVYPWPDELRRVQECWHVAVSELLKRRYGIPEDETRGTDWGVWYSALWSPTGYDLRGDILVVGFHAAGWCGVAAMRLAPVLQNRYYTAFLVLLIFYGVLHDWYVARRLFNPVSVGILRLRSALAALAKTKTTQADMNADTDSGSGASMTITEEDSPGTH